LERGRLRIHWGWRGEGTLEEGTLGGRSCPGGHVDAGGTEGYRNIAPLKSSLADPEEASNGKIRARRRPPVRRGVHLKRGPNNFVET